MKIYSTPAGEKLGFAPRDKGRVSIYVCGPTVYDEPHLGHARSALSFDIIRRYLEYRGYEVSFVMNYTDVDDKITERAAREGIPAKDIANRYIGVWDELMSALGIERPAIAPRATEHIDGMIEMISELVSKKHAYESDGDVYFSIETYPAYGELSGKKIDELQAGARVEPGERKKHPLDFALWKRSGDDPSWDAPWGRGRPGWHIECSVMSLRYLGEGFDIHGGGQDLIFPHHENERAQAEAAGHAFARLWMHVGLVNLGGEKMAKSTGNFVTVAQALSQYPPEALRMLALRSHYRTQVDFGPKEVEQAAAALERIDEFFFRTGRLGTAGGGGRPGALQAPLPSARQTEIDAFRTAFAAAMDDDFNTPAALATIFDAIKSGNQAIDAGADPAVSSSYAALVEELLGAVGLTPAAPTGGTARSDVADRAVEALLELRESLRAARMYELADTVRNRLENLGVIVEDTPSGPRWRWAGGR